MEIQTDGIDFDAMRPQIRQLIKQGQQIDDDRLSEKAVYNAGHALAILDNVKNRPTIHTVAMTAIRGHVRTARRVIADS